MAPHGDSIVSSYTFSKPPARLSSDGLKRTVSDMSFELMTKEAINDIQTSLTSISEVLEAKCECCGMMEECTPEYMEKVHNRFLGKWICGLCSEAVTEEMEKNGGNKEEALSSHMNTCVRFNKRDRAYPVLCQAEAMRNLLKKSSTRLRSTTSLSPRDHGLAKKPAITRSSSCIPAITN